MEGTVQQLDPDAVYVDPSENSRYSIGLSIETERLAESLIETGGIERPVEVEKLTADEGKTLKGKKFRLVAGFRRFAALALVNSKGAGLKLPAIVRDPSASPTDRLKLQLRENIDRRNLSPMDRAVAMQKLEAAGVPKVEIAKLFAAPAGRKGMSMQPVSNAHINMTLSFLKFPKAIQARIADGRLTVGAAYELSRLPAEKWEPVLQRAETDRLKTIDKEDADVVALEKSEAKAKADAEAAEQAAAALETAKAEVEVNERALQAKKDETLVAFKKEKDAVGDAKKPSREARVALEAEARTVEKALFDARTKLTKLTEAQEKLAKSAEEKRAKLDAARAESTGKDKTTIEEVRAASVAEGATAQVKLNIAQVRSYVKTLLEPGTPAKVLAIGTALQDAFDGGITDKELFKELCKITGEVMPRRRAS